jgi:hypothetical protein
MSILWYGFQQTDLLNNCSTKITNRFTRGAGRPPSQCFQGKRETLKSCL